MSSVKSVYTDGACSGNPGPGGWGVVVYFEDGTCHELGGAVADTTNNRMELQAAIASLDYLQKLPLQERVPLYTDSEYVKKGITQWVSGWKRKGWKTAKGNPVLNQDLWQALDQRNADWVEWRYVKGHSGDVGNDRCDEIARSFSLGQTPALNTVQHQEDEMTPQQPNDAPPPSKALTLENSVQALRLADEIAEQGYLLSSKELSLLLDAPLESVQDRTEPWIWRNWQISPHRVDEEQFWRLQRQD